MHPLLWVMIFALFFVHVVNSFLLPLIKACLRAMSCFNCDARSSKSKLLCNLLLPATSASCDSHGSRVSQSDSSSTSGSVTRAHSYSQLPALLEVVSKSFHTHRTPGQDLEVRQTLVPHSATRLLLKVVDESSHLPHSLCHFFQEFVQFLFECW